MSDDLKEKIARAMHMQDRGLDNWHRALEDTKDEYREMAEAALAEIESAGYVVVPGEPTEIMIEKGMWSRSETGEYGPRDIALTIYRAMIDEALNSAPALANQQSVGDAPGPGAAVPQSLNSSKTPPE